MIDDVRVTEMWDADRTLGLWFPQQQDYKDLISRPLAWDIYFLYDGNASWDETPSPLIDSGSTIISNRNRLNEHILPLLSNS